MRAPAGIAVALAVTLALTACDRKPPGDSEMLDALQTAFDVEARQAKEGQAPQISSLRARNCEATAMVGPVVYSCEVVVVINGRETTPRRVLFHKSINGWVVPP